MTELPTSPVSRRGEILLGLSVLATVGSVVPDLAAYRELLRAGVGALAFSSGAFGTLDVRRSAMGFAALGALGLALVGVGPNHAFPGAVGFAIGVAFAMGGVLGLGGSIHRLGRLGPDVAPLRLDPPKKAFTKNKGRSRMPPPQ